MANMCCNNRKKKEKITRNYAVRRWLSNATVGSVVVIHVSMLLTTLFSFYFLLDNHISQFILLPVYEN